MRGGTVGEMGRAAEEMDKHELGRNLQESEGEYGWAWESHVRHDRCRHDQPRQRQSIAHLLHGATGGSQRRRRHVRSAVVVE